MKLLISGLPAQTSLEDLRALVFRYSHAACKDIRMIGEGDHIRRRSSRSRTATGTR
jgi:hypothetical protein